MFFLCSASLQKKLLRVNEKSIETYSLDDNQYSIQIASSITDLSSIWDKLAPKENIFLQKKYLEALELYPPAKMNFRYAIFYKDHEPIGVAYYQGFHVNVEESIQNKDEDEEKSGCIIKAFVQTFKNWIVKRADFNVLICGNLLLTGEHGYSFKKEITEKQTANLIHQGTELLHKVIEQEGSKTQIILIKDYLTNKYEDLRTNLTQNSYNQFVIQPSMYLKIQEDWKTFEDYLGSMSSKYRVRAKRAAKKGKVVVKRELTEAEVYESREQIFELYKQVADNAGFNSFMLHEEYFYALKKHLGEHYKLIGYFIEDKMIAFYTGILNGEELEAHFLGVDSEYNRKYQVYLNILYDLVRMGIYHEVKEIDFARTALEIKSSVGAEPRDMHCFMRHRNSWSSALIKLLFSYLNPEEKWVQRRPFKAKENSPAIQS